MERKLIISEQPKCKTCGKPMKEWNPFATEDEHIECASKRISASLIELVKRDLINQRIEVSRFITYRTWV